METNRIVEHAKFVERLTNPNFRVAVPTLPLLHAAMGLVTESAEIMDAMRKAAMTGELPDTINLAEEAGDILFYLQMLAARLNVSLEEIASLNMAKLRRRYPEGFDVSHFKHRDLAAERSVLESHRPGCTP